MILFRFVVFCFAPPQKMCAVIDDDDDDDDDSDGTFSFQ